MGRAAVMTIILAMVGLLPSLASGAQEDKVDVSRLYNDYHKAQRLQDTATAKARLLEMYAMAPSQVQGLSRRERRMQKQAGQSLVALLIMEGELEALGKITPAVYPGDSQELRSIIAQLLINKFRFHQRSADDTKVLDIWTQAFTRKAAFLHDADERTDLVCRLSLIDIEWIRLRDIEKWQQSRIQLWQDLTAPDWQDAAHFLHSQVIMNAQLKGLGPSLAVPIAHWVGLLDPPGENEAAKGLWSVFTSNRSSRVHQGIAEALSHWQVGYVSAATAQQFWHWCCQYNPQLADQLADRIWNPSAGFVDHHLAQVLFAATEDKRPQALADFRRRIARYRISKERECYHLQKYAALYDLPEMLEESVLVYRDAGLAEAINWSAIAKACHDRKDCRTLVHLYRLVLQENRVNERARKRTEQWLLKTARFIIAHGLAVDAQDLSNCMNSVTLKSKEALAAKADLLQECGKLIEAGGE